MGRTTSIPSPRGKQVKTDRIDAAQLVQFYANGLLTLVSIPEPEQDQDRDLIRSRQKLLAQKRKAGTERSFTGTHRSHPRIKPQ